MADTKPVLLVQGSSIRISNAEVTDITAPVVPANMLDLDITAKTIQYQGGAADEIDVTVIASTAKEFRLGLEDPGTMSVSGHWAQTDPAQAAIRAAAKDKKTRLLEVTFGDGSRFAALVLVSQRSWDASVSGVVSGTFNFRLTGDIVETDPPEGGG